MEGSGLPLKAEADRSLWVVKWLWLKINRSEGQTAGFGTHVSTYRSGTHFGLPFFFFIRHSLLSSPFPGSAFSPQRIHRFFEFAA